MIKQIRNPILYAGLAAGLAMLFFAGCGREKKVDYRIVDEDIEGLQTDKNSGKSSVSQFAEEKVWNEAWTINEGTDDETEVTVEAEIRLPETDDMWVVEVMVPQFDAERKERIIKEIFGDEDVYYNDTEHLPRRELEKIYAEYEARSESSSEMERETAKQYMKKYEKLIENASDTYTLAEAYEVNEYIGKIKGKTYELGFYEIEGETEEEAYSQWINFYATDMAELCPEEYPGYTRYMAHPYMTSDKYTSIGENGCELSVTQAEQQARNFLEALGLEYPVLISTKPLLWGDETMDYMNCYDWPANGYVFTFEYGINEVSFPGFESSFIGIDEYSLVNEETGYSKRAQAVVYVTDQGIIDMYAGNPVETIEISECVKLLPLNSVQNIMKEQIAKSCQEFNYDSNAQSVGGSRKLVFTHIELLYFRVSDKNNPGNYSYIPVWRLGEQIGEELQNNRTIRNPVLINAIDGSLIEW